MIGACKKIVRLILMSNISRRKFLKGAGVAVLAVAASGVLAGCSKDPVVPATDAKLEKLVCSAIIELVTENSKNDKIILEQDNLLHDVATRLMEAEISGDPVAERMKIESNKYPQMDGKRIRIEGVCYGKAEGETDDDVKRAVKYDLASFKASKAVSQISVAARKVDGVVYYAFITFAVINI